MRACIIVCTHMFPCRPQCQPHVCACCSFGHASNVDLVCSVVRAYSPSRSINVPTLVGLHSGESMLLDAMAPILGGAPVRVLPCVAAGEVDGFLQQPSSYLAAQQGAGQGWASSRHSFSSSASTGSVLVHHDEPGQMIDGQ